MTSSFVVLFLCVGKQTPQTRGRRGIAQSSRACEEKEYAAEESNRIESENRGFESVGRDGLGGDSSSDLGEGEGEGEGKTWIILQHGSSFRINPVRSQYYSAQIVK